MRLGGVSTDPFASWNSDILVTLRRFDHNTMVDANLGPFIPCERRLRISEISGIQGRDI